MHYLVCTPSVYERRHMCPSQSASGPLVEHAQPCPQADGFCEPLLPNLLNQARQKLPGTANMTDEAGCSGSTPEAPSLPEPSSPLPSSFPYPPCSGCPPALAVPAPDTEHDCAESGANIDTGILPKGYCAAKHLVQGVCLNAKGFFCCCG